MNFWYVFIESKFYTMKKTIGIFVIVFFTCSLNAQVKKDTMKLDSSQIEKIKKMPMDTIHYKMPTKPVLPEEQRKGGSTTTPIHPNRKGK